MKTIKLGTLSLVLASLLVGCGSSSDDNSVETKTGTFIDSAVINVDYKTTSGLSGKTDSAGKFSYKSGDKVELRIGNLILGEVAPKEDGLISPATLTATEAQKNLLLRTLQTLDADHNASNGIQIKPTVANALKDINETSFSTYTEETLIQLLDQGDKQLLDTDYDGHIDVSETEAVAHFDTSIQAWENGEIPTSEENSSENNNSNGNGNGNGNGNSNGNDNNTTEESQGGDFNLSSYPLSTLTPELKASLAYMGNEERLAYDVYQNLYNYHITNNNDEIKQLKNISEKSEVKHVGLVQDLVKRYNLGADDLTNVDTPVKDNTVAFEDMPSGEYDIPTIQELYDTLYAKGTVSKQEALFTGCMVEVTDVEDLDKYILLAEASNAKDVIDTFDILRKGSYNHYWAFDKGLKNLGVTNGCYVEGDALLTNKENIYPTNENQSGEQ